MSPNPKLTELLQIFAKQGYAAFEDGEAKSDHSARPGIGDPYMFSRLCLYLGMHDYGFHLGKGMAVDAAYTEGHGDLGIDGAALQIGNEPILTVQQAEEVFAASKDEPVRLLLVQAKRRGSKGSRDYTDDVTNVDIATFGTDARRFLTMDAKALEAGNKSLRRQWHIFNKVRSLHQENEKTFTPEIVLLFAYAGRELEHINPTQKREMVIGDLRNDYPGSRVELEVWGREDVIAAADFAKLARTKVLQGASLIPLPHGPAKAAYIGYVSAKGLLDALSFQRKRDGKLIRQLDYRFFADNPRYYLKLQGPVSKKQGIVDGDWNPGALSIRDTLEKKLGAAIGLGHNGVTVVVRGLEKVGTDTYRMVDPQVVNGCQSCFILNEEKDKLWEVVLPLKIIETSEHTLSNYVVEAANTQRPLTNWDMLSLRPEIRQLQREFERGHARATDRLWLRRRYNDPLGEWIADNERAVSAVDLVALTQVIIKGRPDLAHKSKEADDALPLVGHETFLDYHEPKLYIFLAWLLVAYKKWRNARDRDRYAVRYHIMFALWHLVDDQSGDMDAVSLRRDGPAQLRFEKLIKRIVDDIETSKLVDEAESIVIAIADQVKQQPNIAFARLRSVTDAVREAALKRRTLLK